MRAHHGYGRTDDGPTMARDVLGCVGVGGKEAMRQGEEMEI